MTDYSQLPEWTCHKVVRAAKIEAIGLTYPDLPDDLARVMVVLGDGNRATFDVSRKVFSRGFPACGDYLVVYSIGTDREFVSWSPAKELEEGYTKGRPS